MRKDSMEKLEDALLFTRIQQKRKKMLEVAGNFGLNSNQTLTASQELDELINVYVKRNSKVSH
jgi:hypothetical protein